MYEDYRCLNTAVFVVLAEYGARIVLTVFRLVVGHWVVQLSRRPLG